MKKLALTTLLTIIILSILTGCGGGKTVSKDDSSNTPKAESNTKTNVETISLEKIKKAAVEAGYTVTDDYISSFMDDVKSGFSVEIIADDKDIIYSVFECGSEDSAIKNAKTIDEAGYNIAIRNGKIVSCYGVEDKEGTGKDLLKSIVEGNPIAIK